MVSSSRIAWFCWRIEFGGLSKEFLFYVSMRHFDSYHAGEWASSLFFATMKTQLEECILNRRSRFDLTACYCLLALPADLHHRRRFIPPVKRILRYPPPLHRSRIFSGTRRSKYLDISCAVFIASHHIRVVKGQGYPSLSRVESTPNTLIDIQINPYRISL